jgi:hypothetical protein
MAYRARFPARRISKYERPRQAQVSFSGEKGKRSIKKTLNNVAKAARKGAEFTETLANEPLDTVAMTALRLSGALKQPIGFNGLSLMPSAAKERSVSGAATGDVTTSATMYAFRPPRKRYREGEITYVQKAETTYQRTSLANIVAVGDINVLDAEPVLNNAATSPYSRLTIRKCFDEYLKSQVEDETSTYELKKQQTSIHVKSVSSELMVKNNSNDMALVDVYELVPQHALGPSTYSLQRYATGYMSPTWTYLSGLDDALMLEDPLEISDTAAKPMNSTLWNRTWKVIKKVRLNLTANSLHRHKSSIAVNKTVSYPEAAQFSSSGGKFAGWNPTYMVVQKGGPTGTSTAAATDITYTCNMELKYTASTQEQAKVIVYDSTQ